MRLLSSVTLSTICLVGCQSRDPDLPPLVPVSGTITHEGMPLAKAAVYFMPTGATLGTGSSGVTDDQGHYELHTLHNGKGAPVGAYKVTISRIVRPDGTDFPPGEVIDEMGTPHKQLLSPKYSNMEQSILSAEVPEGGKTIDFSLVQSP